MNPDRVLLEARGIGRLAPGKPNWLLREVSFTVRGGERLAIVGATGSLARSLALLDPIDEGEVLWRGDHDDSHCRHLLICFTKAGAFVFGRNGPNWKAPLCEETLIFRT